MKAIVSTTYSDTYLFFLPIVTWAWNRLGLDVICFMPHKRIFIQGYEYRMMKIYEVIKSQNLKLEIHYFTAPEHKEATYAQCLRNFGGSLDLDENELLCTSDVDMVVFKKPPYNDCLTVWGSDLVPQGQFPQCYITGTVKQWRGVFAVNGRTYQQCIDDLLGEDECQDYRGCRWSTDQEQSYLNISKENHSTVPRSNGQNQFALNRLDRDDSYILDRLNLDNIDFHMNRPGYEEKNFEIIMKVLAYHYPSEDLSWMRQYQQDYLNLLA